MLGFMGSRLVLNKNWGFRAGGRVEFWGPHGFPLALPRQFMLFGGIGLVHTVDDVIPAFP